MMLQMAAELFCYCKLLDRSKWIRQKDKRPLFLILPRIEKNLDISELDASQTARALSDVDISSDQ